MITYLFRPIRRQLKESRCTQVVIFASFFGPTRDPLEKHRSEP